MEEIQRIYNGERQPEFEFGFQKVVLIKMTLFRFVGKFPEAV
jgi:hypothetical protein